MSMRGNRLSEAGLTKAHVVRATVYPDDIDSYGALNEVYGEFFEGVDVKPSRSTVGVAALPIAQPSRSTSSPSDSGEAHR